MKNKSIDLEITIINKYLGPVAKIKINVSLYSSVTYKAVEMLKRQNVKKVNFNDLNSFDDMYDIQIQPTFSFIPGMEWGMSEKLEKVERVINFAIRHFPFLLKKNTSYKMICVKIDWFVLIHN